MSEISVDRVPPPQAIRDAMDDAAVAVWLRARDRLRGAGYGRTVPRAYERASAALAPRIGGGEIADLAGLVSSFAIRVSPRAAEKLCVLAEIAARRYRAEGFATWLRALRGVVKQAAESAMPLLENLEMLMGRLSISALEGWIATGYRVAGADATRRKSYFAMEDPEALRALEQEAQGESFFDLERPMRAYLTAAFGVTPPLRIAPAGGAQGAARRCSFAGGVLLIPPTLPGYKGENETLFRAAMAHLGAHLRFTPQRFPVGQLKPLQLAVVSLIEDARVETLAIREMPGLARLWLGFHRASPGGLATAPSLFARLAKALLDPDFEDPDGWVRKGREMFFAAQDRWHDPVISREIGNLLGNDLGQLRVQFNAKDYVVQPAYRDDNLGLWDFGEEPPETAQTLEVPVDSVKLRNSDPVPGSGQDRSAPADDAVGRAAPVFEASEEGRVIATYPEYDYAAGKERGNWTTVREYSAGAGNRRFWAELRETHGEVMARVEGLIRSAEIGRARRERRQAEGEVLDLDACIDAATALRSGAFPDHRIYQRQAPPQRDLAVSLLLDISQSTADPVADSGQSVLDMERAATAVLAHAMHEMGDPFAINAFSSAGREDVRITPIKSFATPFGEEVGAALAGLRPGYSTRLGAALRHAGQELATVPRYRRLLFLITDGEPSDVDCPDPDYLIQDARHAVRALQTQGIDVFCVGLGRHNREQETAIFGRNGFVQVERLDALPDKLVALYLRVTR